MVKIESLPTTSDDNVSNPTARMADLAKRLESINSPIFFYDASPHPIEGPRVLKSLVPSLEGETMSYYRIGERGIQRLLNRGIDWAGLGENPDAHQVLLTSDAKERLGGEAWIDTNRIKQIVGPLYPLYREPSSHKVALYKK